MSCFEQRRNYTIRIDVLYSLPVVVAIRYREYLATRSPRGLRVVDRIADGDDLCRCEVKISAHLQQLHRVGLLFLSLIHI